ncbi:MAG: SDR family oxidoreductase [Bacteroidales bacterium]|nr:SDR family oxidoreductase [Bacteroidales bacterium]
MSLKGKVVIVTGASSGIGLACVRALAKQGAKVVIAARSVDKLAQIEEELRNQGAEVLSVAVDVTSEEDCRMLVEKTVGRFGGIDVLINNAGISMRAMFVDLDLNVLKRLMDVNFWGAVYCTKYALPYILKNKGSVVGVSSIAGFKGLPARTGYSASKFALYGFLDTLRVEYLRQGLHVMVIAPGFTSSNIRRTALAADGSCQGESPREEGKMMSAEKVADYLIKGILRKKRTVILTAEGKAVMFLKSLFPALLDRLEYQFMSREPDSPFK